ncbi:FecR family protein [Flaviramulus aquimarinus]|uniref:FecR family protein n=1 Tax=Flaviramulus aquimarinus TaxID=1170456 RepID=A0ABP9FHF3_9FLAO
MNKEHLIKKWLNNELTDAEKKAFEDLDDYKLNTNILEAANCFKASNFSNADDFEAFKQQYESNKKPVKKLNWIKPLIRIAAVIVISFGIYFFGFNDSMTSIETLASEKRTVELPDHSKVALNVLTQIAFNKKDWSEDRHVTLNGEAYFIVEKGSKFDVITSTGIVSVVGTQFNVKQRKNYFEVKCFEGVVKVVSNTLTRTLRAGDTFQILNGIFIEHKTIFKEPQWVNAISSFNDVPFTVVIDELERQYNVKITLKNVNTARKFSGGFNHNNLEEALISITKPMGLTYQVSSSNDVVIHENTK